MYVLPFCLYNACSYIEIDVFLFYHRASLFVHSNLGSALGVVWTCNQWSNSQVSFKSYTFLFANRNINDSIVWLERLFERKTKTGAPGREVRYVCVCVRSRCVHSVYAAETCQVFHISPSTSTSSAACPSDQCTKSLPQQTLLKSMCAHLLIVGFSKLWWMWIETLW